MSDSFSGSATPDLAGALGSIVDAIGKVNAAISSLNTNIQETLNATKLGLEGIGKTGNRMASALAKLSHSEGPAVETIADIGKPLQMVIDKVVKQEQKNTMKGIAASINDAAKIAVRTGGASFTNTNAVSTNQILSLFQETSAKLKESGPDAYVASLSTINQSLMRTMAAAHPDLAKLAANVTGAREKFLSAVRVDMETVRHLYDNQPVVKIGFGGRKIYTGEYEDRAKGIREAYTLDPEALYGPDVEEDLMAKRGMELLRLGKNGVGIESFDEYKKNVINMLTLEMVITKKAEDRAAAMKQFGASYGKQGFDFDETVLRGKYDEEIRGKAIAQARAELAREANAAREAAELGPAPTKMEALREHLDSLGYRFITLSYLTAKFATLANNAINSTVGIAMAAQTEMGKIQALLPGTLADTTEEARGMQAELGKMAVTLAVPFEKLVAGAYDVVSAFPEAANKIALIETAARMAKAGVTTTANTIKQLVSVAKAFGDESQPMIDWISNVAVSTVRLGVIEMGELSTAMQRVAPAAANFGVTIEEAYAGVGALSNVTGSPQQAATQMRALITSMANPTGALKELYAKEGVGNAEDFIKKSGGMAGAIQKIRAAADAAGGNIQEFTGRKEAMLAVIGLSGAALESYNRILHANVSGISALYDATSKATSGVAFWSTEYTRATERSKQNMIKLGEAMLPIKTLGAQIGAAFGAVFSGDKTANLLVFVGAFATLSSVMGGLLGYASLLTTVTTKMQTGGKLLQMIATPKTMLIVLAALAALVAYFVSTWKKASEKAKEFREEIKEPYIARMEVVGETFGEAFIRRDAFGMRESVRTLEKDYYELFNNIEKAKAQIAKGPGLFPEAAGFAYDDPKQALKAFQKQFEATRKALDMLRKRMENPGGTAIGELDEEQDKAFQEKLDSWRNRWAELLMKKDQLAAGQIEYFNFQEEANSLISSFYGEARKISVDMKIDLQGMIKEIHGITGRGILQLEAALSKLNRETQVSERSAELLAGLVATDTAAERMTAIQNVLRSMAEETTLMDSYVNKQMESLRAEYLELEVVSERNKLLGEAIEMRRAEAKEIARSSILNGAYSIQQKMAAAASGAGGGLISAINILMNAKTPEAVGMDARSLFESEGAGAAGGFKDTLWEAFGSVYKVVPGLEEEFDDREVDYSVAKASFEALYKRAYQDQLDSALEALGVFVTDLSSFDELGRSAGAFPADARRVGLGLVGTSEEEIGRWQRNEAARNFYRDLEDKRESLAEEIAGELSPSVTAARDATKRIAELMRELEDPWNSMLAPAILDAIEHQKKVAETYAALGNMSITGEVDNSGKLNNWLETGGGSSMIKWFSGWGSGSQSSGGMNISAGLDNIRFGSAVGSDNQGQVFKGAGQVALGAVQSGAGKVLEFAGKSLLGIILQLLSNSESFNKVMNGLNTMLKVAFEILDPVLDAILAPLIGIFVIMGKVLGTALVPILQAMAPVIAAGVELFVTLYNIFRPVFEWLFDALMIFVNIMKGISGIIMLAVLGMADGIAAFVNWLLPGDPMARVGAGQWASAKALVGAWGDLMAGTEGNVFQAITYDEVAAAGVEASSSGGSSAGGDVSVTKAPDQYFQFFLGTDVVTGLDGKVVSLEYIVEQFKIAMAESEALEARA